MITKIGLVTICSHERLLIIDHIPCAVYYIPVLTYFITGGLYLLIPLTHFTVCSPPLWHHLFVLSMSQLSFFSVFCLLEDTCK